MIQVVAGFPGVGKTYVTEQGNYNVVDLDLGQFTKPSNGKRTIDVETAIKACVDAIEKRMKDTEFILISIHGKIFDELARRDIPFAMVIPDVRKNIKEHYLDIYRKRGNDEKYVEAVSRNWSKTINLCYSWDDNLRVVLCNNKLHMDDALKVIKKINDGEFDTRVIHSTVRLTK